MALDTQTKRASSIAIGMTPWYPPTPWPSGVIDQAERQTIGWGYSGNLVGAPVVVDVIRHIKFGRIRIFGNNMKGFD